MRVCEGCGQVIQGRADRRFCSERCRSRARYARAKELAARVFVDDRAVGTTPVRLPEVTPGSHAIRMELPEHRVWTETVQVTRGKTTRVAGSLEPIR